MNPITRPVAVSSSLNPAAEGCPGIVDQENQSGSEKSTMPSARPADPSTGNQLDGCGNRLDDL
jgi:hypothetical protein